MKPNAYNKKKNHFRAAIVSSLMFISILSLAIAGFVYFSSRNSADKVTASSAKDCSKLLSSEKYDELYHYLEGVSDISQTFSSASDQKKYTEFVKIYSNYLNFTQESDHLDRCTYYGEYEIYLKWSIYYASMAANLSQSTIQDGTITGSKSPFKDIIAKVKKQLKEKTGLSDNQIAEIIEINNEDSDYFTALASKYMEELKSKLTLKEFENES